MWYKPIYCTEIGLILGPDLIFSDVQHAFMLPHKESNMTVMLTWPRAIILYVESLPT